MPKTGILIRTTRSGELHASYFDPDNDFNSLLESLQSMADYFYDEEIPEEVKQDESLLLEYYKKLCNEHDCGSIDIVENEY